MSKKVKTLIDWGFNGDPNNEDDVYLFILNTESRGHLYNENIFKSLFPSIYEKIRNNEWDKSWSFSQILYHYFTHNMNIGTCNTCGKPTSFHSFKHGYYQYCSSKCSNSNSNKKLKCENTCIERYGVKNTLQSDEVKQNIINTCIEKYGVPHPQSLDIVKEKTKRTCQERYGVDTPFQKSDFKEKASSTYREKYGVDWISQSESHKIARANTCIEKYGVSNPSYNPETISKRHNTMIEHFGGWYTSTRKMVDSNHKLFLERHPNIIGETENNYICTCGECNKCDSQSFEIDKDTYKQRSSYGYILCPKLNPLNGTKSMREVELLNFIKSIYTGEIIEGDRSILEGKEIDIYLPELKIAFEFNGLLWHSEFSKKPHNYHQKKSLDCLAKGITLIHVWEDDWIYKREIVEDYIKSKLGCMHNKIFARKCNIVNLTSKDARKFFDENHLQGYTGATYKIGLEYEGKIVASMLIGQLRKSMGSTPKENCYEIYRFVSVKGSEVIGGFSKILKYFEREFNPSIVITYGDLSITTGNVYETCGFMKESLSNPCYSWQINSRRYHRSNFMKSKLKECIENPNLTENEIMRNRGANKIWDAGKIKFVKIYE